MGETPVTQAQYRVMAAQCALVLAKIEGHLGPDPSRFKGDDLPVEQVNWYKAQVVAGWLTTILPEHLKQKGYVAELPTEAMWEYACRAGTETEYWSGDGEAALSEVGWYGDRNYGTHPVGALPANPWGLHDMHGNVWEWCADVWKWCLDMLDDQAYRTRVDGGTATEAVNVASHADEDPCRVLRGGCRAISAWVCRSASRIGIFPRYRERLIGFRLCVFPGQAKSGAPDVDLSTVSF